ncbi:glucose-1-phosphate cytidylyltransferase [Paenibacillus sp. 7516]|uniref:glucose-1-phosphate cytidylyltransferase n=1 Tax=Paenibacillus sp. 7516 TaxID=2022549 RepID=UPI000BA5AC49|nr:glucose-1-phosphate cytidylyltransferase [Paenibacillus sp. 7516]PAF29524.1 glucose-1-phosphate cytidylyltransferase [Paenibacillus sp. 7516]
MKVVILAGGYGTRISEESHLKPKPMVEIGGKPILWHIMKLYSHYGFNDFVICLGYKGYVIKEYFAHYFLHESDITFDFTTNKQVIHHIHAEPWKVTLVDTGLGTMTGGRLKRVREYLNNESFMLTYGDGVSDVNIKELVEFHQSHGKQATVTTVQPNGRFGSLELDGDSNVLSFKEKPKGDNGWINGGFFILNPAVMDYIEDDQTIFEEEPLRNLALNSQLQAFKHGGFWQPMDTLRDKNYLEELWTKGNAPWSEGKLKVKTKW